MLATFVVAVLAVPLTLMALAGNGEAEPVEAAGSPVGPTTAVEEKVVATTDGTEPAAADADGEVDNKAIATLSDGFARREAAAEDARAEAEAATNAAQEVAAAAVATTVPMTAAPATTAPPTTTAPVAAAPVVTAPPLPPPPTLPPPPPVAAPPVTSAVWDQIAACESGGNWSINTGNGYYGGLQFLLSTWVNMGGRDFAEYPHQASRAGQIAVAERVVASAGGSYGAWGGCAASLGLP